MRPSPQLLIFVSHNSVNTQWMWILLKLDRAKGSLSVLYRIIIIFPQVFPTIYCTKCWGVSWCIKTYRYTNIRFQKHYSPRVARQPACSHRSFHTSVVHEQSIPSVHKEPTNVCLIHLCTNPGPRNRAVRAGICGLTQIQSEVVNCHVDPRFHPTLVAWNLGWTRAFPTSTNQC